MRNLLEWVKVHGAGCGQIIGRTLERNPEYEVVLKGDVFPKRFTESELTDINRDDLPVREMECVKDMGDVCVWVNKPQYEEHCSSSGNGAAMRTYLKIVKS